MQGICEILKKVYAQKVRKFDELDRVNSILQECGTELPVFLSVNLKKIKILSCRNGTICIGVKREIFTPELHFYANALKDTLNDKIKKNIRLIRFISQN
jgi:hypothetical protein